MNLDGAVNGLDVDPFVMAIDATSLENGLTIDATGKSRIVNVDDGHDWIHSAVTIRGLTLTGGNADADDGGAIRTTEDLTVTSSTISGNMAWWGGGGIWASGNVAVTASTISGNSAWQSCGGVYSNGDVPVSIEHSIVAGNASRVTPPDLHLGTGTLTVRYSVIGSNNGTDLVESPVGMPDADGNLIGDPNGMGIIDPLLGPLADNGGPTQTHALLSGSPAIDAGDPDFAAPPDFDQRGNPRVADGNADDVPRIDTRAFELLRGDVNGDGYPCIQQFMCALQARAREPPEEIILRRIAKPRNHRDST